MLVLSRRKDESIIFTLPDGVRIEATIVSIRGDQVRLGISAPDDVQIHRSEIQALIDEEQKQVA